MRRRNPLLMLFALLGAYAVCAQSILLRETQVILFGSELSWGLVLAFWLAGVSVGAHLSGRLLNSGRRPWVLLAVSSLAMPLLLSIEIGFLRASRLLFGTGPGEYVGPWEGLLVAAMAAAPVSLWIGLAFPAASELLGRGRDHQVDQARSVGWVYQVESAGSLAGGALFSFVLVTTLEAYTVVIGGGAFLAAATAFLVHQHSKSRVAAFCVLLWAGLMAAVSLTGVASVLEGASTRLRWQSFAGGLELVASDDSKYQNIAIGSLGEQFSLYTNGTVAATWPDHAALAVDAHLVACQHPSPARMLVLGGGAEGMLKELLRHDPARLDYVTLDRRVLELSRPLLDSMDAAAITGPTVHVHITDPRRFVARAARVRRSRYDLVFLAAPEPASALEARLYTEEFFNELSRIMSDDGVLAFSLTGSAGAWSREVATYVGSMVTPLQHVFPDVLLTFGDPVWVFAARKGGVISADPAVLSERYRSRDVSSPYFHPLWFEGASDLLDADKRTLVERALNATPPRHLNSDSKPVAAVYKMRLWLSASGSAHRGQSAPKERRGGLHTFVLDLRLWAVVAAIGACMLLTTVAGAIRGKRALRKAALICSVSSTGFAVLALEIVLLYTFQVLYGYVYGMVGFVVGIFMFGLVAGSSLMNRHLHALSPSPPGVAGTTAAPRAPNLSAVLVLDVALALFTSGLLALLPALRSSTAGLVVQVTVYFLVAATGVLGGLVFPLAAALWLKEGGGTALAASVVDATDHLGGAIGALVTGVALVTVLGISGTCIVVAMMKLMSFLTVAVAVANGSYGERIAERFRSVTSLS